MEQRISPASRLEGSLLVPGDKSISHRYAMIASVAEGTSKIHNYSTGADCQSTLNCMRSLGVQWTRQGNDVEIQGRGLEGLVEANEILDAGNSGSTSRMLSGILAAQPFVRQRRVTRLDEEGSVRLVVDDAATAIPALVDWANEKNLTIDSVQEFRPPFDDVFVELVRRERESA